MGAGTKGPRIYAWARVRVIESRDGFPGPEVWLLARRSVRDPTELAYYFALAPKTVSLQQLARVAGTRYTVEQVIKQAKSEVGFDRYEAALVGQSGIDTSPSPCWRRCGWRTSGWWPEKKKGGPGGFDRAGSTGACWKYGACWRWRCPYLSGASANASAWSYWRRRKCYQARLCHYRHRSWPKYAGPNPLDSS